MVSFQLTSIFSQRKSPSLDYPKDNAIPTLDHKIQTYDTFNDFTHIYISFLLKCRYTRISFEIYYWRYNRL